MTEKISRAKKKKKIKKIFDEHTGSAKPVDEISVTNKTNSESHEHTNLPHDFFFEKKPKRNKITIKYKNLNRIWKIKQKFSKLFNNNLSNPNSCTKSDPRKVTQKLLKKIELFTETQITKLSNSGLNISYDKNTYENELKRIFNSLNACNRDDQIENFLLEITLFFLDNLVMNKNSLKEHHTSSSSDLPNITIHSKAQTVGPSSAKNQTASTNPSLQNSSSNPALSLISNRPSHANSTPNSHAATNTNRPSRQNQINRTGAINQQHNNASNTLAPFIAEPKLIINHSSKSNSSSTTSQNSNSTSRIVNSASNSTNLSLYTDQILKPKPNSTADQNPTHQLPIKTDQLKVSQPNITNQIPCNTVKDAHNFEISGKELKNQDLERNKKRKITEATNSEDSDLSVEDLETSTMELDQIDSQTQINTGKSGSTNAQIISLKVEKAINQHNTESIKQNNNQIWNPVKIQVTEHNTTVRTTNQSIDLTSSQNDFEHSTQSNAQPYSQTKMLAINQFSIQTAGTNSTQEDELSAQNKRQKFISGARIQKERCVETSVPDQKQIREPICIYINNKYEKILESSPKLLEYVRCNSTAKFRSVMRDKKKALIFPETNEDTEELMKIDGTLFPGCYRRNIGLEKLALVFINISQKDVLSVEISDLFKELNITGSSPIVKNKDDAKIIKVFFKSAKDKLIAFSNHHRNGINITLSGNDLNIKVEPCTIQHCNRCNKLQHREDKCKENKNH